MASVFFYAWGEPKYVILILLSTFVNYYLGLVIDNQDAISRRRVALIVSVLFNIGILVYFKYSTFFAEIVQFLIRVNLENTLLVSHSPMPIGISFFTFQILSYQIDVYRRNVPAQKSLYKLALYIMLFPQMIAGPIVRYSDIAGEIEHRNISLALAYSGLKRFMLGFSKKYLFPMLWGRLRITPTAILEFPVPCLGWGRFAICFRYTMISAAIQIWQLEWAGWQASIFRKTLNIPMLQAVYKISGGGGIFHCHRGFETMYIFL